MKFIKIFLVFSVFVALTVTKTLSNTLLKQNPFDSDENDDNTALNEAYDYIPVKNDGKEPTSLQGARRILVQKYRPSVMTCDKYPRVCRTKGSSGPDCCKKKCVNVTIDKNNCGKCGKKCKYSEICCKGKCANPMIDRKNCGGCSNKCNKKSSCLYGMCSYAN